MNNNRFLSTTPEENHCILRSEFDSLEGEISMRKIGVEKTDKDIKDLQERSEYHPHINVFQIKEVKNSNYLVFSEIIYANNPFLDQFESLLRRLTEPIQAEGFEGTPEKYKHYFGTEFTRIPGKGREVGVLMHLPGKLPKLLKRQEIIQGIDYSSSCTLKIIEPSLLYERLKGIENKGNFSATIQFFSNPSNYLLKSLEHKLGNEHMTICHYVLRKV